MVCKHILLTAFLNELELIFLHTVKWFKVLLYYSNNLICFKWVRTNLFAHWYCCFCVHYKLFIYKPLFCSFGCLFPALSWSHGSPPSCPVLFLQTDFLPSCLFRHCRLSPSCSVLVSWVTYFLPCLVPTDWFLTNLPPPKVVCLLFCPGPMGHLLLVLSCSHRLIPYHPVFFPPTCCLPSVLSCSRGSPPSRSVLFPWVVSSPCLVPHNVVSFSPCLGPVGYLLPVLSCSHGSSPRSVLFPTVWPLCSVLFLFSYQVVSFSSCLVYPKWFPSELSSSYSVFSPCILSSYYCIVKSVLVWILSQLLQERSDSEGENMHFGLYLVV